MRKSKSKGKKMLSMRLTDKMRIQSVLKRIIVVHDKAKMLK